MGRGEGGGSAPPERQWRRDETGYGTTVTGEALPPGTLTHNNTKVKLHTNFMVVVSHVELRGRREDLCDQQWFERRGMHLVIS